MMSRKPIIIVLSGSGLLALLASCVMLQDRVKVTDARTGQPIAGAKVTAIYPAFSGSACLSNPSGVARLGVLGIPRSAAGATVEISAPGYQRQSIHTAGIVGGQLNVTLKPAAERVAIAIH
jgi:hypothetical protein